MDGARAAVELFGIEEKKPELLAAGADSRANGKLKMVNSRNPRPARTTDCPAALG